MSKIAFCNDDKSKILITLQRFEKDKTKKFNDKKYKYANGLILCKKSNLEIEKADTEFSIENKRAFAAFLAIVGGFFQWYFLRETIYSNNFELIGRLIFFAPSAFFLLEVANKSAWLHVIKIAIALKSELDSTR